MRTYKILRGLAVAASLAAGAAGVAAGPAFESAQQALDLGVGAFKRGAYEDAMPALEFAAAQDDFLARYYLARIYGDNAGGHANHAKAYAIYQRIADENTDADPDDDRRAPYVGRALTALALYVRNGLPDIGVPPNLEKAAEHLRYAALFFRNEDAQFELAKMQIKSDGAESDAETAKHWLSVLSQKGHAGAQAFLADLYWRGGQMERDPVRALVLSAVSVSNAPLNERVWIEDIYQNIFCGATLETRARAASMVDDWSARYVRKAEESERFSAAVDLSPGRTCGDGEPVTPLNGEISGGRDTTRSAGAGADQRAFFTGSSDGLMPAGAPPASPAAKKQ